MGSIIEKTRNQKKLTDSKLFMVKIDEIPDGCYEKKEESQRGFT